MTTLTPSSHPTIPSGSSRTVSPWWRAIAIFLALLLAMAITAGFSMFEVFKAQIDNLQTKLQTLPQTRYIAVLTDDQQLPALLITLDPHDGALQVQRLNAVSEGREDSMQLWALPAHNAKARSLGVLESKGKTLRLPAKETSLSGITQLAISVEDKGGVSESIGPRLPYLFKGHLVQKAL